jgi:hypothetical protein
MQVVFGLVLLAIGFSLVYYSNWMYYNIGAIGIFEKYLGTSGGSRLGYKLIGLFIFFLGALTTFDLLGPFMFWVFYPVIKMMYPNIP